MTPPVPPGGGPRPAARVPWLRVAAVLVVCAAAWFWLSRHADLQLLATRAGQLPWWAWALAAAGLLVGHAMRALRLQREFRRLGHVPWRHCLRIVLAHNALVLMLPLRTGEAGFLFAVRRQWGVGWGAAAIALLRWRLQDAAVLAVLAAALLVPVPALQRVLLAAAAALVLHQALPWAWRWLRRRAGDAANDDAGDDRFWAGAGASIALWTLKVLANGGLLAALTGLAWTTAWRAALGGELAGVQPLQPPAGLGVYEAGIWLAAHVAPALEPTVVSAALAVHAFSLAVALGAAAVTQLAVPPALPLSEEIV